MRISKMWICLFLAFPCSSYLLVWVDSFLLSCFLFLAYSLILSPHLPFFCLQDFLVSLFCLFSNSQTIWFLLFCWFAILHTALTSAPICFSSVEFSFCLCLILCLHNNPFIREHASSTNFKICGILTRYLKQFCPQIRQWCVSCEERHSQITFSKRWMHSKSSMSLFLPRAGTIEVISKLGKKCFLYCCNIFYEIEVCTMDF